MQTLEEKIIYAAGDVIKSTLADAITSSLIGYNKPMNIMAEQVIKDHQEHFRSMYKTALDGLLDDVEFKSEIDKALRVKLAKMIINKATGELESHLDKIKSDPVHKAELTIAVSNAIKGFTDK